MLGKILSFLHQTLLLAIGSSICAFAVKAFLVPQNFLSGGLTGAALIIHYVQPSLSVAMIYFLINIPLFLLGLKFVSMRFIIYSLWGMLIYSFMLYFITIRIEIQDQLLTAIVAGCITGIGVAIILRSNGSTGGSEIMSVMLFKLFSLSIGTGAVVLNLLVITCSAFLFPIDKVLYSFIYSIVVMLATNTVYQGFSRREAALIISDHCDKITEVLTRNYQVGITKLNGKGGYHGKDKTILFSVVCRKDIASLKKAVLQMDPDAFMAIMAAGDVTGLRVGNQPHW